MAAEDPASALLPDPLRGPGWQQYSAEPVEVVPVAGDHTSLMAEPHVAVLAERLRERLDRVQERIAALPVDSPLRDNMLSYLERTP